MDIKDFDFRLWDRDKKRYIRNNNFENEYIGIMQVQNTLKAFLYSDDEKHIIGCYPNVDIELYIGLSDSNDKRIYHGDILQQIENKTITRCLVYADKGYGLEKMITLDNVSFYEDNMVDLCECDFYEECNKKYQIIGNIHTDSHLLTQESITQAYRLLINKEQE